MYSQQLLCIQSKFHCACNWVKENPKKAIAVALLTAGVALTAFGGIAIFSVSAHIMGLQGFFLMKYAVTQLFVMNTQTFTLSGLGAAGKLLAGGIVALIAGAGLIGCGSGMLIGSSKNHATVQ